MLVIAMKHNICIVLIKLHRHDGFGFITIVAIVIVVIVIVVVVPTLSCLLLILIVESILSDEYSIVVSASVRKILLQTDTISLGVKNSNLSSQYSGIVDIKNRVR